MGLIRAEALGEDYEDKQLEDGEHELRVEDSVYKPTKKGDRHMIAIMLKATGAEGEGSAPINEYLIIPNDGDDRQTTRLMMRRITRFLKAFGYPMDRDFDPEEHAVDLKGLTATVATKQEEGTDGSGDMYARLRLPKG